MSPDLCEHVKQYYYHLLTQSSFAKAKEQFHQRFESCVCTSFRLHLQETTLLKRGWSIETFGVMQLSSKVGIIGQQIEGRNGLLPRLVLCGGQMG